MGNLSDEIFNEENCEILHLIPEQEIDVNPNYWYLDKEKVKIKNRQFVHMLSQNGFRKYPVDQDYFYVYINNKIVQEVNVSTIKDCVEEILLNQAYEENIDGNRLMDAVVDMTPTLFNRGTLEYLKKIEGDFKNDTSTQSFIYFKNCYVEVTADNYQIHKYENLDKYIWQAQMIDRNFNPESEENDFKQFIMEVCRDDDARFNAMRSAIGYLLHTQKDISNTRAIIFMDEKFDDGSNGGCGKSLVGNAISKVRKSLRLDGRNFKFERFAFQSYEPGTNIIEFNDVGRNFNFGMLFNLITDSIVIEKKNRDGILIPFEYSPKVLISTNYAVKGTDESSLRRQFVIEFSDHFNRQHTPVDEFGRRFFDDWNEKEWDSFFMFMIGCLQYYLKNGLVDYDRVNLTEKKLLVSTSEEFLEFVEDIEPNKWYIKKEIFQKFIGEYPEYGNNKLRQNTFSNWLKTYSKLNNMTYELKRIMNDRYFRLRTEDLVEEIFNIQTNQENLF